MVSILLKIPVGKSVASGINSEKSLWEMARREAENFSKFISRDAFFLINKEFMYFTCQEPKNFPAFGGLKIQHGFPSLADVDCWPTVECRL